MSFDRLSISDFIEQQLPDFIVDEFPAFVSFFKEYYKSLEIKGAVLDIANNILEYEDFDSLTKVNLVASSVLAENINSTETSIKLTSLYGFEKTNGIVSIGDEIIFYQDVDSQTNTLLGCQRGYSATTQLKDIGTSVDTSIASQHVQGDLVKNLSNLFLFSIIRNYENQYLEGFPFTQLDSDIDPVTLLKNIKDFYSYKGTDVSIEFLFRSIYDEEIIIKYPKNYVIKSSYSDWTVDDIIKVESIIGDPYKLVGNELTQTDVSDEIQLTAIIDAILVNNISNYASGNKNIYEIRLNILTQSNFKVPNDTILRRSLGTTDNVITVDSTIGFANTNGIIQIDDEVITYRFKSFNQFFDCNRGTYGTIASNHDDLTPVTTTEYLYGYVDGIQKPENLIKLRLLGVMSSATISDGSSYYQPEEPIFTSDDGVIDNRKQFTTWRINEDGNLSSSPNNEINDIVKDLTTEITAVYKTDNFAYVASTGLPNHSIGSFIGTNTNVGNQYLLKTIPLKPEKITQIQLTGNRSVGLFVNGVEAYSCNDIDLVPFGDIISVDVSQNGYGFEDNIQPSFRILNTTASGATFKANISNGKVLSVDVLTGGSNYTEDVNLEISYGFDATATILSSSDIVNGSIKNISVLNGGNNYIVPPNVVITDIAGRGRGAFARANITNGVVTSIDVLSGGIDYNDKANIIINLISKGTGVLATAKVRKWTYDRVFKLTHIQNALGQWIFSQTRKTDVGNGYLFVGDDVRFGLEYAYSFNPKLLRSSLNDNLKSVNFNYEEIDSNFAHSPIIGWAYDGNPIYGPYGFTNPLNQTSPIKRMESSYVLTTNIAQNRPNLSIYPLGSFVEDYQFVNGSGDLDFSNGRFCKTPDFPEGTYAYFISVDSFGKGIFPYILGKTYNSVPAKSNLIIEHIQTEDNLPLDAKRIKTSKTPSKGFDVRLIINDTERGVIDSFACSASEPVFKAGDYFFIDSTNADGAGAQASVEAVFGTTVSSVTYSVASGFSAPGVTISGGYSQYVFPTKVTAQDITIPYEAFVTTSSPHNLSDNDIVYLDLDTTNTQITKTFRVKTGAYQTVKYNKLSITTQLVVDVSLNQTTINVTSAANFKNNDYLKINQEIFRISSINYITNQITVLRAQFGTSLRLHAATNLVTLYVHDSDPDYRIAVGNAINSPGVTGTIYNIDKENSTFEVKITSGTLTSSSVITDSSTPTGRNILIASVTSKRVYWEIDPSNTGNYFVRDLAFEMIRGTRYIFDISDPSNTGYTMLFSEDLSNINQLSNIALTGVPGTAGSIITFNSTVLDNQLISRVYYYEQNNLVSNNKVFFEVKLNYFEDLHTIKIINDYTFKFPINGQLETTNYNNVSYFTYSKSAIGSIAKVKTIDGGEGYKILPLVEGIVHSDIDNAKFTYSIAGGSISNVSTIISAGNRYSNKTIIKVISSTGFGAILEPSIISGKIIDVNVIDGGRNYSNNDTIIAIDTDAECFPLSSSIGKVKSIRFANYGSQFNIDRTLSKELIFNYKLIITNLSDEIYKNSEIVYTSDGSIIQVIKSQKIGVNSYLVDVKLIVGQISQNIILTGSIKQTTSVVYEVKGPKVYGNISGYVRRVGYYDSDLGKLNSSSQKLTDSYYYQDFSYVIRSTRSLNDYKSKIDKSTHPLGFKLFGEVAIETDESITTSGITGGGSVSLPPDYSDNVVIIAANEINVESQLNYRRYEVQILNTKTLSKIPGVGAAALNFLENQIEAVRITDISGDFDGIKNNFAPTVDDGNFPQDTKNTSILLSINEIFQEPVDRKNITSISYSNNIAVVTTNESHGYAYSLSGVTYPTDQYTNIEGVTWSSDTINFNDKFEIYSVDSSNSFNILFDNPTVASGVVPASGITNAKVVKGQFEYSINNLKLYETPKEGSIANGVFYNFLNGSDNERYSYKVKNILFDGQTTQFNLYKINGTNLITEVDENLLIFVDGVLQKYGESYTINRTLIPNRIIFNEAFESNRTFFGYTFSKYKILNDISPEFNDTETIFNLQFGDDNIKLPDLNQLLVLMDGVPQTDTSSYTIIDSLIIFNEPPPKGKKCNLLYFYGKTFEKTITIWNGNVFERIQYIGEKTPDECNYYNKVTQSYQYIESGDSIEIEGETPKEVISIDTRLIETGDNYEYTGFVFTDNSYIKGKNAVATAVVTGVTPGQLYVSSIFINSPGLEYETAPIVLFKPACDNPGRGAKAYSTISGGKVISVTVTNPGSGYTESPNIVFGKKYDIIRERYPVYKYKEIIVDTKLNDGVAMPVSTGLNAGPIELTEEYELPYIVTIISTSQERIIDIENKTNRDPSRPALAYVLQTFDQNKFTYEPINLNDPLASYLGTNVNIENVSRYAPNLTIGDFTDYAGRSFTPGEPSLINYAEDAYVSFGLTLRTNINSTIQSITISGNTSKLPPSGYIEFGNELISYTSISGFTLLNCQRGVLNTAATSHVSGEYMRLAWRG